MCLNAILCFLDIYDTYILGYVYNSVLRCFLASGTHGIAMFCYNEGDLWQTLDEEIVLLCMHAVFLIISWVYWPFPSFAPQCVDS